MAKLIFIFFASLFCVQCLTYQEEEIKLNLFFKEMIKEKVGKRGTVMVSFEEREYYIINDTKKEPCFESKIRNGNKEYEVNCGLWDDYYSSKVIIFCNIENSIPSGDYYLLLNETNTFTYKDYNVTLNNCDNITFTKVEDNIIDLYSDRQKLIIENEVDTYELKFNIVSYNQEPLFLNLYMPLDNCSNENNILICTMTKHDLLAYLSPYETEANIASIDKNNNITKFPLIPGIRIYLRYYPKEDIYVGIKKLLVPIEGFGATFAYETNVTDVSNFYNVGNSLFPLTFINKDNKAEEKFYCSFLKYENNPLILLCGIEFEGSFYLKEIEQEIIINYINIQYNYRIQPVKYENPILIIGEGRAILWSYPKILDFTKTNDSLYVQYVCKNKIEYLKGLTYNENEKDLECQIINDILKCEVPKSHFNGKTNGLYFLKHTNPIDKKVISYEIQPIRVILDNDESDSKGSIASLSINYLILLILLLI